jgi:hypothetical protein
LTSCAVLSDPPSGQWPGQRRLYAQTSLFCTVQLIGTMNPKVAPIRRISRHGRNQRLSPDVTALLESERPYPCRLCAVDSLRAASCGRGQIAPSWRGLPGAGVAGLRQPFGLALPVVFSRIEGSQLVRQRHPALERGRQGERDALRETWLKPNGHPAGSSQEGCRWITAPRRWTGRKRRVEPETAATTGCTPGRGSTPPSSARRTSTPAAAPGCANPGERGRRPSPRCP